MSTDIEWTDETWNPVRGCSVISPGCTNCYAMKQAHRFSGSKMTPNGHGGKTLLPAPYHGLTKQTTAGPQWTGVVRPIPSALDQPRRWKTPRRVFVNSMSDLFHEGVSDVFILNVFLAMEKCPQHTFQILTKRAERMRDVMRWLGRKWADVDNPTPWPLPNVWMRVSVENQHFADERIPLLLQTPAAVRFISAEPLLGPVNLTRIEHVGPGATGTCFLNVVKGEGCSIGGVWPYGRLDWVIVGGESGPGARPFDVAWARSIVGQCKSSGVPVFVKQLGRHPYERRETAPDPDFDQGGWTKVVTSDGTFWNRSGRFQDKKGGDMAEWPSELRVREFPR